MLSLRTWFVLLLLLSGPVAGICQSDNLTLNTKDYTLMNQLDIKLQHDSTFSFSTVKPLNRQSMTERVEYIDSLDKAGTLPFQLSKVDRYNIRMFLMDNYEWTNHHQDSFRVKHPILHAFYETTAHLYAVDVKDFNLRVDPVLNLQYGHSNDGVGNTYQNTRGLLFRGSVANKIGFYTYISDNQEVDPLYVQQYVTAHNAVPGAAFYKDISRNGYDYFDFRGGISFTLAKYVHVQYAYDRLFIGNGFRSLDLSDFSAPYLFLRLNLRIWKLDYEMILAQTMQSVPQVGRDPKPQNYLSMHHLSAQIFKWFNLGLYENVMENGNYGFQLSYTNPIIFYRGIEGNLGAAGKCNIAIDAKSNIGRHVQLYGNILFDEFRANDLSNYGGGNWANKQALQGGVKYINAFGVHNLDLQGEMNLIRPFVYTNFDSTTNYTAYNQPLAHPLGANIREFDLLVNYQPIPRLYLAGKAIQYLQGLDSGGVNYGNNLFDTYNTRPFDNGWHIGTGLQVHSLTLSLNAAYEILNNTFLEFTVNHRTYNVETMPKSSTLWYQFGFRMNIARRVFDF